jgi:hypothetical protein
MERINVVKNPITFDIPYKDVIVRVKIEKTGIKFWRRASQGNLDEPRALDKTVEVKWEDAANNGYCYSGTRTGIKEGRGPASSRGGLHYLTHKNK